MNYAELALSLHEKHQGKLEVRSLTEVSSKEDLATIYTPGVAAVCTAIHEDPKKAKTHTMAGRTIAVVSDGTAVLGLGNIGPAAAMPVMEGKAVLFKELGGVEAVPLCIDTQDTEEIITFVKQIAPSFAGINLEDISSPRCFEIEQRLQKELDIPVFHDDQNGTAIVVLAGLINALKLTGKTKEDTKVVLSGAGAAGLAIAKLLHSYGFKHLLLCDSKGIIHKGRSDLNTVKEAALAYTNAEQQDGTLQEALQGADIFLGISAGGLLHAEDIKSMNLDAIVFAMANPTPEIMPEEALAGGAAIVATGRSDFPNQMNNALVFPGLFKGALKHKLTQFNEAHYIKVAEAIAAMDEPSKDKLLPDVLDKRVPEIIANALQ